MADHGNDKQIREWLRQHVENGYVIREKDGVTYRSPLNLNETEHRAIVQTDSQPNLRQIQGQQVELENERRPTRSLKL